MKTAGTPLFATAGAWLALAVLLAAAPAPSPQADRETDPLVLARLARWQDWKFGLMMHWGPYSQWGVVESWSICSEDEPWCRRSTPDYVEYKKAYEALPRTFDPVKFDPDAWAAAAEAAGMRYVVLTTKHHDGFTMFDTKQTDYRITGTGRALPRPSQGRRAQGRLRRLPLPRLRHRGLFLQARLAPPRLLGARVGDTRPQRQLRHRQVPGAVAALPRLHLPPDRGADDRLRAARHPLARRRLGPARAHGRDRPGPLRQERQEQDIDMPRIAAMARRHQPGLIVVDRTVTGRYENYRTPEQEVPEKPLPYVWETCMTMGGSWSYVPDDRYKSAHRLVHLLVDIVSKGGNFLLNIGPSPEGEFAPEALDRLRAIGEWMKVNGEAIYATRPVAPYKEAKTCFTALPDGTVHAIYLADEDEAAPPAKIMLTSLAPADGSAVRMLGVRDAVRWEKVGKGALLTLPAGAVAKPPCRHAWVFKFKAAKPAEAP